MSDPAFLGQVKLSQGYVEFPVPKITDAQLQYFEKVLCQIINAWNDKPAGPEGALYKAEFSKFLAQVPSYEQDTMLRYLARKCPSELIASMMFKLKNPPRRPSKPPPPFPVRKPVASVDPRFRRSAMVPQRRPAPAPPTRFRGGFPALSPFGFPGVIPITPGAMMTSASLSPFGGSWFGT